MLDKFFSDSFTLYTGLFAAIFGMAFPLLLQCIQRIDEKYNSSVVTQVFERDWIYRAFQWLLFPYILLVCAAPLILGNLSDSKTTTTLFQGFMLLYIFVVAILMVLLYVRITTYYNIDKLLKSIRIKNPNSDILFCFDLAKFTLDKGYQEAYIKAMTLVAECYVKERMVVEKDKPVEYSENLYRVLLEMGRNLRIQDSKMDHRFSDIMSIILDSTDNHFLSDRTYGLIWYMLNNASASENTEWIHDYWTWAVQYHQFKSNNVNGGSQNPEMRKFLLYHVMLGAVLSFHRRYECIAHMMSYSQNLPLKFPLVPDTFTKIVSMARKLDSLLSKPMTMESKFQIIGLKKGVNTDNAIFAEAMKYLALLFIRMWSYQDYNINYCKPLDVPTPSPDSIDENETNIRLMLLIRQHIDELYASHAFENLHLTVIPEIDDVYQKIDLFISACEKRNEEINKTKGFDQEKLKHIYDDAVVSNSNTFYTIPIKNDIADREKTATIDVIVTASMDVERRFLQIGKGTECGGIGDCLASQLNLNICKKFIDVVLGQFEVKEYEMSSSLLLSKLEEIMQESDIIVLDFASGINFDEEHPVYYLGRVWVNGAIFVCDRNCIPTLDIVNKDVLDINETMIDENNYLYASINEDVNTYNVKLSQKISIQVVQCHPKANLIFVK